MKKYLKYLKCYGGYVLGGSILLAGAVYMAYGCSQTCCKL